MIIEAEKVKDFLFVRIKEDLHLTSDITELKQIIEKNMESELNFAISLTENSFLSSMSIGTILYSYGRVAEKGGKMALICPNEGIASLLETLSFNCVIDTFKTEEDFLKTI